MCLPRRYRATIKQNAETNITKQCCLKYENYKGSWWMTQLLWQIIYNFQLNRITLKLQNIQHHPPSVHVTPALANDVKIYLCRRIEIGIWISEIRAKRWIGINSTREAWNTYTSLLKRFSSDQFMVLLFRLGFLKSLWFDPFSFICNICE